MILLTQLRNGILALSATVAYLFRRNRSKIPKRILVIQSAKLGDMVCTTPLFRAIKENYPGCELFVIGNPLNAELLAGNPHIKKYVVRPEGVFGLRKVVSEVAPDVALLPGPDADALAVLMMSGIPRIIVPRIENGWSPYETKAYRLLSRFVETMPHRMGSYAPREYLRLLEPLGIFSEDTRKEVFVSPDAGVQVDALLQAAGYRGERLVGIAPGVGNKAKSWGGRRFAEVALALGERSDIRIVVIGGKGDREEVEEMRSALQGVSVIDMSEKLSLEELKALIRKLSLFISVDTGPIYIAEALGIPTVDIVGPMDENEQPPRGGIHRVVVPSREAPVLHIMNASVYDKEEAKRQIEACSPKEVNREAEALLA